MYITTSAPNKRNVGAVNGLGHTLVSLARGVGPALVTSFYSLSVERNIFGGQAVYILLSLLSVCALVFAARLPCNLWDEDIVNDP